MKTQDIAKDFENYLDNIMKASEEESVLANESKLNDTNKPVDALNNLNIDSLIQSALDDVDGDLDSVLGSFDNSTKPISPQSLIDTTETVVNQNVKHNDEMSPNSSKTDVKDNLLNQGMFIVLERLANNLELQFSSSSNYETKTQINSTESKKIVLPPIPKIEKKETTSNDHKELKKSLEETFKVLKEHLSLSDLMTVLGYIFK